MFSTSYSSFTASLLIAILLASQPSLVNSQTYSKCNPLQQAGCPADPALGTSTSISFTSGASNQFTSAGAMSYSSAGAGFTVAKQGDSPTITSKFYIMFGHVEYVIKAAPGQGIVSSAILQSDDLDEIDWEWLGGDDTQVQTNYFGKGLTTSYNRGGFSAAANNHDQYHTYTVDWTPQQIVWSVDGTTVRVLQAAAAASGQYPQTPMQIKVGTWAGGDPSNPAGTIEWAGGLTDYSKGPFTMYLQSINVADYSTGNSYSYSGTSGAWTSIVSNGGSIDVKSSPGTYSAATNSPTPTTSVPTTTSSGTALHYGNDSASQSKTGWPWVTSQSSGSLFNISSPSSSSAPYVPVLAGTGNAVVVGTSLTRIIGSLLFCITFCLGR